MELSGRGKAGLKRANSKRRKIPSTEVRSMEVIAQIRKERLAEEAARAGGFRLREIQREIGCIDCHWFDLEAAIKELPYCCAPVNFGDLTIEVYMVIPDIRHRCHKYQRLEGLNGSEAPILDNGGRNVASKAQQGR